MADVLTVAQRSKCMAAIKCANTTPEIAVRRIVHGMGFRFRLHGSKLPGKPDLVLTRMRAVIFVHGCFWHQHHCSDGHIPRSRVEYWGPKLTRNRRRDASNRRRIRKLGWRILTIWECQTQDQVALGKRLRDFLFRKKFQRHKT